MSIFIKYISLCLYPVYPPYLFSLHPVVLILLLLLLLLEARTYASIKLFDCVLWCSTVWGWKGFQIPVKVRDLEVSPVSKGLKHQQNDDSRLVF